MTMTPELIWLTLTALMMALMWMPYVLERIARIGLVRAMGYSAQSGTAGFEQPDETPRAWAQRAFCAQRNALESFPVFAALVITAHLAGLTGGAVLIAVQLFFFARLAHFGFYVLGVPVVRTFAFFAGFGAEVTIVYALLTAV